MMASLDDWAQEVAARIGEVVAVEGRVVRVALLHVHLKEEEDAAMMGRACALVVSSVCLASDASAWAAVARAMRDEAGILPTSSEFSESVVDLQTEPDDGLLTVAVHCVGVRVTTGRRVSLSSIAQAEPWLAGLGGQTMLRVKAFHYERVQWRFQ